MSSPILVTGGTGTLGRLVAARLVELALGEPRGFVPDLGGPRVYTFPQLAGGRPSRSGCPAGPRPPSGPAPT